MHTLNVRPFKKFSNAFGTCESTHIEKGLNSQSAVFFRNRNTKILVNAYKNDCQFIFE